jgi:hypothetical protein
MKINLKKFYLKRRLTIILSILFVVVIAGGFGYLAFKKSHDAFALRSLPEALKGKVLLLNLATNHATSVYNSTEYKDLTMTASIGGFATGSTMYYFWWDCASTATDPEVIQQECRQWLQTPSGSTELTRNFFGTEQKPVLAGNYRALVVAKRGVSDYKAASISYTILPSVDIDITGAKITGISPDYKDVYSSDFNIKKVISGIPTSAVDACLLTKTEPSPGSNYGDKSINPIVYPETTPTSPRYRYNLKCTYNGVSNEVSKNVMVAPYVGLNITSGSQSLTSTNLLDQTMTGVPMNSKLQATFYTEGSTSCVATASPSATMSTRNSATTGKIRTVAFDTVLSNPMTDDTVFSLECTGAGGTSTTSLSVKQSKGYCQIAGNSNIQAMMFCDAGFIIPDGNNNTELKGSFVAKNFDIGNSNKNIRFFYDYTLDTNVPPGFRFLNMPKPKETGNQ